MLINSYHVSYALRFSEINVFYFYIYLFYLFNFKILNYSTCNAKIVGFSGFKYPKRENFRTGVRDYETRIFKEDQAFLLSLKLAPRLPLMPANTCTDKSSTYHRERRKTERKEGKKKAIVDVVRKQGIWSPFTRQQKKCVFFTYSYFVQDSLGIF
jgi:hypothetical protein